MGSEPFSVPRSKDKGEANRSGEFFRLFQLTSGLARVVNREISFSAANHQKGVNWAEFAQEDETGASSSRLPGKTRHVPRRRGRATTASGPEENLIVRRGFGKCNK